MCSFSFLSVILPARRGSRHESPSTKSPRGTSTDPLLPLLSLPQCLIAVSHTTMSGTHYPEYQYVIPSACSPVAARTLCKVLSDKLLSAIVFYVKIYFYSDFSLFYTLFFFFLVCPSCLDSSFAEKRYEKEKAILCRRTESCLPEGSKRIQLVLQQV